MSELPPCVTNATLVGVPRVSFLNCKHTDDLISGLTAVSREHGKHSIRVAVLSRQLAAALELSAAEVQDAEFGGKLHDIGKLLVPPEILNKPAALDAEEQRVMRTHANKGLDVASAFDMRPGILAAILHHHERFDGGGYPHGLAGSDIPLLARLVAVTDTYDTIITDRRYQKRRVVKVAVREIGDCAGAQFDPDIAGVFLEMLAARRGRGHADAG